MTQNTPVPKAIRARKPKVRTGCATCKLRRVKCDESKPLCSRCQRAGILCGGYPKIPLRTNDASRKTMVRGWRPPMVRSRPILPRLHPEGRHTHAGLAQDLRQNPAFDSIEGKDVIYFDIFRYKVAYELSGYLYMNFWGRTVLCEGMRDPCICQAILAIGALSKGLFLMPSASHTGHETEILAPLHPKMNNRPNEHQVMALRYYSRAIALFRERIQATNEPTWSRTVLVMTLLLLAFEFMQGNMSAADGIMKNGMQLLEGSFQVIQSTAQEARLQSPLRHGIDGMDHFLPCISLMSGFTFLCKSQHAIFKTLQSASPPDIYPSEPRSLTQVVALWGNMFLHCMLFVTHVLVHGSHKIHDAACTERELQQLITRLNHWKKMWRNDQLGLVDSYNSKLAFAIISMQHSVCTVLVNCCIDDTEMAYDRFECEFQNINNQCAKFLDAHSRTNHMSFTFNGGNIMSSLSLVVSKCRHFETRMRAIQLFRRVSWREGTWDCEIIRNNLGQVALEEQGRDSAGFINTASRWVWLNTHWVDGGGTPEYSRVTFKKNRGY